LHRCGMRCELTQQKEKGASDPGSYSRRGPLVSRTQLIAGGETVALAIAT